MLPLGSYNGLNMFQTVAMTTKPSMEKKCFFFFCGSIGILND